MKKLFLLGFIAQLGTLNGMHNTSTVRVVLPGADIIKKELVSAVFEDILIETPVVSQLAGQEKSYDETLEILSTNGAHYFKKKNQPSGRIFFFAQLPKVAQRIFSWQSLQEKPSHTCKLHAHLKTHEHLNTSPYSNL